MEIVGAGLEAIQPEKVLGDWQVPTGNFDRVFLVGFGKGAAGISKILEGKLGDKLTDGWIIDATPAKFSKVHFTLGTHPLPSETNVEFTRNAVNQLTNYKLTTNDLVLVVVCGGGSAMLTDPTVSLEELIKTNAELLKSGKSISEMNAVRKGLDAVKAGGLARKLAPAKVVGLIFSDVPGNDLSVIASGPTVADGAENILMVSNMTVLSAMKEKAEKLGFAAEIVTDRLEGEAREVAVKLLDEIRGTSSPSTSLRVNEIRERKQGVEDGGRVLLYGGETTVTAKGDGKGGRNQELVLAGLHGLVTDKTDTGNIVIASVGTDGWDNTPVAGAIGDGQTIQMAQKLGLDFGKYLENNDSYNFFQKVGDYIETGRLAMNVSDVMVVLSAGK